jgi:hypothetical protein
MLEVSSITAAIQALKMSVDVIKGADRAEVKSALLSQLVDIQTAALEMNSRLHTLQEENAQLRRQTREQEELVASLNSREAHFNTYWKRLEDGSLDGPYCLNCLDSDQKWIRMHQLEESSDQVKFYCQLTKMPAAVPVAFLRENRVADDLWHSLPSARRGPRVSTIVGRRQ